MSVFYCTVEDVTDALEEKASAYDLVAIKRAIAGATDDVDDVAQLASGAFRPITATRYYHWPVDPQTTKYYRLWLEANQILSIDTLSSGGSTITNFFLEPQDYGPPYNRIEIDISSSDSFDVAATGTPQRAITVTGSWAGCPDTQESAGTLNGSISDSVASLVVSDGSLVGIGDHLIIESERLIVTARSWSAVSGGDTAAGLTASAADRTLTVADGTLYAEGELILVDSERLKIVDIAGNNLTVLRAQDGSVLATHSTATTVYARRTLTVTRGAQGSTAAAHTDGVAITRHVVPGAVRELAVAHSVATLLAERRGYAKQAGPASSGGVKMEPMSLNELRERVSCTYGRPVRTRVI